MSKIQIHEHMLNLQIANKFFRRLIGWIGRKKIEPEEALLLSPCRRIHTFGMRTAIDVVFLDDHGNVVYFIENMKPAHLSPLIKSARHVLELKVNSINKYRVCVGDKLVMHI